MKRNAVEVKNVAVDLRALSDYLISKLLSIFGYKLYRLKFISYLTRAVTELYDFEVKRNFNFGVKAIKNVNWTSSWQDPMR